MALADQFAATVSPVHFRQVRRWPDSAPRSGWVSAAGYSHNFPGTYAGEIAFLKRWLTDRLEFIDTNFLAAPELDPPAGPAPAGTVIRLRTGAAPPDSVTYYTLDGSDPRLPGGTVSPRALAGSGEILLTLETNVCVVARNYNANHRNLTGLRNPPLSSPWSGPVRATYVVQTPPLALTEIMYHPAHEDDSGEDDALEFLELKNTGTQPLTLAGFRFTAGIRFVFDATNAPAVLEPGGYLVLVRDRVAFQQRHPEVTHVAGPYEGALANEGERLALEGPLGEPVWELTYDDAWYPATDGAGFSLVPVAEGQVSGTPDAWRPSAQAGGSPGRTDPLPPRRPPILVNEALTHTDPPLVDLVELHNPTAEAVDISGWFLTDDRREPRKFVFPSGSILPPFGYRVVDANAFGTGPSPFNLSSLGEEIWLFSGDGTHLTGYAHGFRFGAAANGVSFGRHVDSLGREHFVAQWVNSPGAPNAGPRIGPIVIHEIMFEPPGSPPYADAVHEYIELYNLTDQPVPLYDPAHPTNTWRLEGLDFAFPPGLVMSPRSHLVVVTFDPVTDPVSTAFFRRRYALPETVALCGPASGRLANEGERVSLLRPDTPQTLPDPFVGYVPYVLVDQVEYQPGPPWPQGAAGSGWSLQKRRPESFGNDPAAWEVGPPTPGAPNITEASEDTDGDGLPDIWETAEGLDPLRPDGEDGPGGDPDGDGMTNLQEYIAGTSPRDAASRLVLEARPAGPEFLELRFTTQPGRTYYLQRADDLGGPWEVARAFSGTAPSQAVSVLEETGWADRSFYRLVVVRFP